MGYVEGAIGYLSAKKDTDNMFYYKYCTDKDGRLHGLFWADSHSRQEYNSFDDENFIDEFGSQYNDWVGMVYRNRRRWAKAYCRGHFVGSMRSTQRLEKMNAFLNQYLDASLRICQLVSRCVCTNLLGNMLDIIKGHVWIDIKKGQKSQVTQEGKKLIESEDGFEFSLSEKLYEEQHTTGKAYNEDPLDASFEYTSLQSRIDECILSRQRKMDECLKIYESKRIISPKGTLEQSPLTGNDGGWTGRAGWKVVKARFSQFLDHLLVAIQNWKLTYALTERWWDTRNTFHLPFGEMTLTPTDFTCITSIQVAGLQISWDFDIHNKLEVFHDVINNEITYLTLLNYISHLVKFLQSTFYLNNFLIQACQQPISVIIRDSLETVDSRGRWTSGKVDNLHDMLMGERQVLRAEVQALNAVGLSRFL
ncbi:hypothetical protein ACH5RR_023200 [Cinchona calisaya]|uniref:Aminotransferase-like plant mobile domain-containing protein n=1 Tax=Cinchona calisaya TaxID=153742 RepID=A0ABD2ZA12_9GENT